VWCIEVCLAWVEILVFGGYWVLKEAWLLPKDKAVMERTSGVRVSSTIVARRTGTLALIRKKSFEDYSLVLGLSQPYSFLFLPSPRTLLICFTLSLHGQRGQRKYCGHVPHNK
jgi:hypothetical protein